MVENNTDLQGNEGENKPIAPPTPAAETKEEYRFPQLNVMILGDGGVGKSSIIDSYLGKKQIKHRIATTGFDFFNIKYKAGDGNTVQFKVWDTAGQERFY